MYCIVLGLWDQEFVVTRLFLIESFSLDDLSTYKVQVQGVLKVYDLVSARLLLTVKFTQYN